MDEQYYISIKNNYFNFREKLIKNINNSSIAKNNEECYLIKESFNNEFISCFNKFDNDKKEHLIKEDTDLYNYIPGIEDEFFINNFSSIITNLTNKIKLNIIDCKFLHNLYEEENLKNYTKINYYAGNNKIIIEYKEKNENKALLLIDPFNINQNEVKAFIISIKKENIFQKIISDENNYENEEKNNYAIISFDKYLNILKLFIHLYYYEKDLLKNDETIFKEDEDYYLIKPEWIKIFKEKYSFSNYVNNLNNLKLVKKSKINYSNLNTFINSIIEERNNINFDDEELFKDKINIKKMHPKIKTKDEISYFSNCYIIN